jgi:NDP-sugar pyrophosphorylase family protein
MKAVILSGGLGTRLKPFTEVIPKPLLPIGEKAVLEIQIERLRDNGFNHIFLATNYKSAYIENFFGDGSKYGVNLAISKEDTPLGTAGPLSLLKDDLTDPFLVMNGDILTLLNFKEFYDFAVETRQPLTLGIKKEVLPFAFGNIFFEGDYVTDIQEKPNLELFILAGIYVMTPAVFDHIPYNTFYGMDVLIKKLLSEDIKVPKYEIKEYWLDIGRLNDYNEAQEAYKEHFK